MAKRNLKHQLIYSVKQGFTPGVKKHALTPGEREEQNRIHSFSYLNNLKDTASDFAVFAKEQFGIEYANDLNKEHASAFLEEKAKACSSYTIQQYQCRLEKIGKLISDNYGSYVDLHTELPIQQQPLQEGKRTIAMKHEQFDSLVAHAQTDCQSLMALKVCEAFGLRVSEVVKLTPNDLHEEYLHIRQAKGGRDRDVHVTNDHQREVLNELENKYDREDKERFFSVQGDSVNAYLSRSLEKLDIHEYADAQTGVHAIRKMWATDHYNKLIEEGNTHAEAWGRTSEELGHSYNREDLFRVYVK